MSTKGLGIAVTTVILPRYEGETQAEYDKRCGEMLAALDRSIEKLRHAPSFTAARPYELHAVTVPHDGTPLAAKVGV